MSQAIRLAFALGFAGLTLLLGGCPMPVEVPRPGALPIAQRDDPRAVVLPDPASIPIPRPLAPGRRIDLPSAGATGLYGVPVLASLDRAYRAVSRGDMRAALAALDDMEKTAVLPIDTWYAAFYRAHALNLWGRVPEAERWAKISTEREIALRRTDINSRTLLGDAKSRLGDVEGAIADYMSVVRAIGAWRFPTFYAGPPANLDELSGMAEAATRAYIGLAFLHSLKRDHVEARRWAAVAERHLADVFSVREHALYGPFVGAAHPDLFLARAANLAFLGASELAIGDSARANAAFATARSYFDAIGYAQGEAYVEALTGLGLLAKRDVLAAKDAVDRAAAAARRTGLIDFIWRIEAIKGEAFLAFGLPREAEHAYRQAQGALDAMVGVLPTDRDKRRFGVGKDDITYHLARLAFERGDAEALFGDLERGRARAFVDMLATVDLEARPEFIEVRNSSRRVESAALGREMGEGTRGIAVVDKTIDALLEEHAVVVERLRQRDPVAAEAVGVTVPALTAIRARLGAEGALLYFLPGRGEDPVRALIAKASGNELRRFSITEAQLAAWLAGFAQAVKGRDAAAQKSLAAELSSSLGVRQWSAGGAHVVPSGTLHHVPWGALDVAGPVAVLPTAGWLLRPSPAKAAKAAAVIGDPAFGGVMPALPGAREEAQAVAQVLGVPALVGEGATEAALRKAMGEGVETLHLATHGLFNLADPLRSALFVSEGGRAKAITAERLFANPLKARLVVLSACETGIGEAAAGDDFLGLPRSFYLGGARTVLASLWPVDDRATTAFMRVFHERARGGDYGAAWLAARETLIQAGEPPWIHGAFVLGGAAKR